MPDGMKSRVRGYGRLIASLAAAAVLAGSGGLACAHPLTLMSSSPITGTLIAPGVPSGPPADPFAGTPADGWADGAAGIVVPVAKRAGEFTAAQVAAAYQTTRKLLLAADLDKQILLGGAPTAFGDLLASQDRADFLAGLNKRGPHASSRLWVESFAPGSADLIGNVIKVRGSMSARSVSVAGGTALAITVNYNFDYPIEPPGTPTDWMRFLGHHYGTFDFAPWSGPGSPLKPWDQTILGHAGLRCGETDGYVHPDYPSLRSLGPGATESGRPIDPYSTATAVPGGGSTCGALTRDT
jgi:hypothetical protein